MTIGTPRDSPELHRDRIVMGRDGYLYASVRNKKAGRYEWLAISYK